MRLFVTGGTGFVGRKVLARALAAGHDITALVRPGPERELLQHPGLVWHQAKLDDDLGGVLAGHDLVLHMAAHTANPPYAPLAESLYWNVQAVAGLFAAAAAAGVQRYVNLGSCFEYADGECTAEQGLTPRSALGPAVSYPVSKAAASVALEGFAREQGVELATLRLFQIYGEGELASRLYPSLVAAARKGDDFPMSAGTQVRDFIEVDAAARQILRALDDDLRPAPGQPVVHHVASGQPCTVLEFAKQQWAANHAAGQLLPGAVPGRAGQFHWVYSDPACIIQ